MLRGCEGRGATPDMAPLSEQIQRLLGRPVHSGGSRGSSGSQASRRSHPPRAPASSSSDSNGAPAQEAVAAATALAVATALATAAAATDTHKPVRLAAVLKRPSNRPQRALKVCAGVRPTSRPLTLRCVLQMTFQQMCKDVHMVKSSGQQVFIESRHRPAARKPVNPGTRERWTAVAMPTRPVEI